MESTPAAGTTMTVYLPVTTEVPEVGTRQEVADEDSRPLTLLLIDDEPAVLETTRRLLVSQGHTVIATTSGEEGVKLWNERRDVIDAVVLDVCMPGIDGEEVHGRLVETDPEVKVLFYSGFQPSANIDQLTQAGLVRFLDKPFTAADLQRAVTELVAD